MRRSEDKIEDRQLRNRWETEICVALVFRLNRSQD